MAVLLVVWGWFELLLILFCPERREMWLSGGGVLLGGLLVVVCLYLGVCGALLAVSSTRKRMAVKP